MRSFLLFLLLQILVVLSLMCQQTPPYRGPWPGIELDPTDPRNLNYGAITQCANTLTPPAFGCIVRYKPGTYWLTKPINLPAGVVQAWFTNVRLIPCGEMTYIVSYPTMVSPTPLTQIMDLYVNPADTQNPCGKYVPPLQNIIQTF